MRLGAVLAAALMMTARHGLAQSLSLQTTVQLKQPSFFEGEPIYVRVTVRNGGTMPAPVPYPGSLDRNAVVSVQNAAAQDMRKAMFTVAVAGPELMDTLRPGEMTEWVIPLHWYWGSAREPTETFRYYAFTPGSYRIAIGFPARYGLQDVSVDFTVRPRSPQEHTARSTFLSGIDRADGQVRRSGNASSALESLLSMHRDPTLAPFATQLLCDVGGALEGRATRDSRPYRESIDALRADYAAAQTGSDQVWPVQYLDRSRMESLIASRPSLAAVPYVTSRLRAMRRKQPI